MLYFARLMLRPWDTCNIGVWINRNVDKDSHKWEAMQVRPASSVRLILWARVLLYAHSVYHTMKLYNWMPGSCISYNIVYIVTCKLKMSPQAFRCCALQNWCENQKRCSPKKIQLHISRWQCKLSMLPLLYPSNSTTYFAYSKFTSILKTASRLYRRSTKWKAWNNV